MGEMSTAELFFSVGFDAMCVHVYSRGHSSAHHSCWTCEGLDDMYGSAAVATYPRGAFGTCDLCEQA